ncbi:MAG: LysR substrate-binding domain-containing protein, partial [Acidimicrobiales bacterium]|nr:LysR substrate-binding domain-containing protein [Acidimicrobiales bacterium]
PRDSAGWDEIPMILAAGGIARRRVDSWFRALNVTPTIYAQVAGNEAIVSMVSLGLGVGVVPKIVLDNSPHAQRVRVLDVDPVLEPYDLGLFTLKRHLRNPLVAAFWSLLPETE